ncbi:glycosyltransferase family 4 protein [Candidatus Uhrbacteria bacterium]|nr:glycosyltransferase family 4 protein [Candidatus Uhrbacteria bacterium]
MRIAIIGTKGVPATSGGVERHVEELAARLAASGEEVTVYGRPWYTKRAPWSVFFRNGIRCVMLPSVATKHLDAISHTFLATLHAMRERPDVYHFHGVGPSLLAFLPRCFRPRARVLATFHCVDRWHAKWGWFARFVLMAGEWAACRFPHETIAVSETIGAYCTSRYHRSTTVIPNGVAQAPSRPHEAMATDLAAFGLLPQRYFLVVSRLVPHKEIHVAIDAFRAFRREHREYDGVALAIVGGSSFTEKYVQELEARAGGDPTIRFLGPQYGSALHALFHSCLAFVHPSTSEGMPIVVLEAAAAGVVPIVSDIPEHREVVDRIGGFLFRTGDAYHLATMLTLACIVRASLPKMGKEIQAIVARQYHWDDIARATRRRYQMLRGPALAVSAPIFRLASS